MILGLGNDLVDIRRIEHLLETYGERFVERVFTPAEREHAERRGQAGAAVRAAAYAKRFAAKEACAKALGTGFSQGVFLRDLGVINLPTGQPTLALTGGAQARLQALTPSGMVAQLHLTLTDEPPLAEAVVLISAVPGSAPQPPLAPVACP